MKSDLHKVDADKLKTIPIDLKKLSDVADNDVKEALQRTLVLKIDVMETKISSTDFMLIQIIEIFSKRLTIIQTLQKWKIK